MDVNENTHNYMTKNIFKQKKTFENTVEFPITIRH